LVCSNWCWEFPPFRGRLALGSNAFMGTLARSRYILPVVSTLYLFSNEKIGTRNSWINNKLFDIS